MQESTEEEAEIIDEKMDDFNNQKVPFVRNYVIKKNYIVKDSGKIIAGINANINGWGILYIDILFVEQDYRNQGLGDYLLNKVEMEAKALGANLVHLVTIDFQAHDFYLRHGYESFGVLGDCPPGHKSYFLKKSL